jgi:3-hydroxyisobutyrate dehydrogenase
MAELTDTSPRSVVAVLGAGGTMGRGMARNLARAGIEVRAWNRTAGKIEDLGAEERVTLCETPSGAAAGADVLLTMLSDADAVLSAVDGAGGVAARAEPGAIWLQASTIGVAGTERCAELAASAALTLVDAPVLGTRKPAEDGELVVLGSGPLAARESLAPVFEAIGKRTMWVGDAGAGSRLKVAVNAWIVSVVEGTAEMLALAVKDAALAVEAATAAGLELPVLAAVARRMATVAEDHGDEDLAAVYRASAPIA